MGGVAPAQQAASLAARRASRRWMERHPDNVIDTSGGTAASTRDSAGSVGSAGEADFDFDSDGTADDVNRGGGGESELQRQAAHFERAAPARGSASSAAAMAAGGAQRVALTPEGLRRCVVASTPDFVVINKPAGARRAAAATVVALPWMLCHVPAPRAVFRPTTRPAFPTMASSRRVSCRIKTPEALSTVL